MRHFWASSASSLVTEEMSLLSTEQDADDLTLARQELPALLI